MGNKIAPNILRLGSFKKHEADWYAVKDMPKFFKEDWEIREFLKNRFGLTAGITKILIIRSKGSVEVVIKCLQPSIIIGKKGGEINAVVSELAKKLGYEVKIKIFDIKKADTNAAAIGLKIAEELKRKGNSPRRMMKRYMQLAMKNGALGIRIECKGRLGGVEIARKDWLQEGAVPRLKLRANLDYASIPSQTKWGTTGVKVWIYNGDIITRKSDKLGENTNVKS